MMPPYVRHAWREGFALLFTSEELRLLATALESDSPELVQGITVSSFDDPLEQPGQAVAAACPIGYLLWRGMGATGCADVAEGFDAITKSADQRLGGNCSDDFIAWFDTGDRYQVFGDLLSEIKDELARRAGSQRKEVGRENLSTV